MISRLFLIAGCLFFAYMGFSLFFAAFLFLLAFGEHTRSVS